MQPKPLEEDCSLKNIAMDAEGAARAQPNQLTPKLKKESNIGNNRVSTQNMENQVYLSQFMFMQDMMKQMAEMQRQAREDRERRHREHMEEMREDREREERRHAEHMEEMQRPYTRTKLAQNPNCNTTADVAVAPTETAKVPAEKAKAPETVEVLDTSKLNAPSAHPNFSVMIHAAIAALKEHNGSSRQAIVKYIMSNYNVGTDHKAIDSSVKDALKSSIQKGLLRAILNADDKKATEASEAKAPKATEAQKIISDIADVAVAPTATAMANEAKSPEATEARKIISAIADNAIAPTATTKAIEAKVPEAIEAQEMIDSRVKATLESVIQEDPLEHSEGKDTSGFPKVVPKVNAKQAKKHDAIKMAKTTKKATGVTKRSTKAKKPIGANKSKRKKKTTNPLKRDKAAEKFKAPKAEAAKKPKAAKPKKTPAKHVRKNVNAPEMIWTKKKRKERWKHPQKEKRKERWKHPLKGKEEREMEAFIISLFK
jgi:histone H1/5